MKRTLLQQTKLIIALAAMLVSSYTSAQVITITSPTASTVVTIGGNLDIRYTATTYVSAGHAELYKGSTMVRALTPDVYQNSDYLMPTTGLVAGSDYRVKVYDGYNTSIPAAWTGYFVIQNIPAPVATAATNITPSTFYANWTAVSGASDYRIDISTNPSFTSFVDIFNNYPVSQLTGGGTTRSIYNGITTATTYYYRLRATSSASTSDNSNTIAVLTLPIAPTSPYGTNVTSNSFTFGWSAPPGNVADFLVDVATDAGFAGMVYSSALTSSLSFNVTGLAGGTTYYARVRARNASGMSGYSSTATIPTLPSPPVATAATQITTSSFVVNWNVVSGATDYRLDISTASDFSSFLPGYNNVSANTLTGTANSKSVYNGTSAATYFYYRVRTVNSSGTSGNSNTITLLTLPLTPSSAPTASSITSTSATLSWSPVSGVISDYLVDISTVSDFSSGLAYSGYSVAGTSFNFTGLSPNTTYYARYTARNATGVSGPSGATTFYSLLPTPAATAATNINVSTFYANWNAVSGASDYRIDISTDPSFSTFVDIFNNYPVSQLTGSGTTRVIYNGINPATTYYYRLRATNSNSTSATSNVVSALTLPQAPVATAATNITLNSFTANWNAGPGTISNYRLDVSTASDFSAIVTGYNNLLVNGTSQSVTGLSSTIPYYYRVRAEDASGASPNSSTITVATLPAAPTTTAATIITSYSFFANWTNLAGATDYRIDISTTPDFSSILSNYNNLSTSLLTGGTNSKSIYNGITTATYFYYRVRTVNGSGTSANSNVTTVLTFPIPPSTAPAASNLTSTSVTLTWNAAPGVISDYVVDISTASDFSTGLLFNNYAVAGTTNNFTGLSPNTAYYARVRARNATGSSTNSGTTTINSLLSTPVATAATTINSSSFYANWNAVSGAADYKIDISTNPSFTTFVDIFNNYPVSQLTGAGTTRMIYNGITAATTYYYRLRATNASSTSVNSNVISALTLPIAPTATAATNVTLNSFTANWTAVTGTVSNYRLDVSTVSNFSTMVAGFNNLLVNGTSQAVTGLSSTITYYYRVRAENATGASPSSGTISATMLPAPPTATAATIINTNSFFANWTAVAGATDYRIDISTVSNFSTFVTTYNNLSTNTLTGSSNSKSIYNGINAATTYYYRVRTVNGAGTSANSNVITMLTLPLAPSTPTANTITGNSFVLTWPAVSGVVTNYGVDVSTVNTFATLVYNNVTSATTTFTVSSLLPNTVYYARVRARNASGSSPNSGYVTVTTLLAAPVATAATNIGPTSFTANWNAMSGVSSFKLDVSIKSDFSVAHPLYWNYNVPGNGTSVVLGTNIYGGDTYYYRLRAVNANGTSGNSNPMFCITGEMPMNWAEEVIFDQTGATAADARDYFDGVGNMVQSQEKNIAADVVLVSATLFDTYNAPVGLTLPAPIAEDFFFFHPTFASNANGVPYSAADFDARTTTGAAGEVNNPKQLGTSNSGTLGWYYSTNNNLEPKTPVSHYPYIRSYSPDGPDPSISTTAMAGDQVKMGSGHEEKNERLIMTNELDHYFAIRHHFVTTSVPALAYKYISTDANGQKEWKFVDTSGRLIATAKIVIRNSAETPEYWSYSFYNDGNQVVAVVGPKDVNITDMVSKPNAITYLYDQNGRLIEVNDPDTGITQYVYNKVGQVRFTQNQLQRIANPPRFSYVNYDALGRIVEAGEYTQTPGTPSAFVFQPASTTTPGANSILAIVDMPVPKPIELIDSDYTGVSQKVDQQGRCGQYGFITYDRPGSSSPVPQAFLYGRVSKTQNQNATTWYSYDEDGNVAWRKQQINAFDGTNAVTKSIEYTYDFFNNVTQIAYQPGQPDAFYHHFTYDNFQQLKELSTSKDGVNKTVQARHFHYLHGPLKRVELATNLQGIDYIYNIDGTLKSINNADGAIDPGGDGTNSFTSDVFGTTLEYFANDYQGASYNAGSISGTGSTNNYDGKIKSNRWFSPLDNFTSKKIYNYTYDEASRLQNAAFGTVTGAAGAYTATFTGNPYNENIPAYDKNGNIQTLTRTGKTGTTTSNFGYTYKTNTNQLQSITGSSSITYGYDDIGQVTQIAEGTTTTKVAYNNDGSVREIRDGNDALLMSNFYDDGGNLVKRITYNAGTLVKTNVYVHDETGTVMAIFEQLNGEGSPTLIEQPVYAGDRIGVYKPVTNTTLYEIDDHLGNVRAVIGAPTTEIHTATMETENASRQNNIPGEDDYFKNIAPRVVTTPANHTPGGNEAVRINNGQPNGGYPGRSVGPGTVLHVAPGDVISAEVYGYYEGGTGYSSSLPLATIIGNVASAFGGISGAPGDPGKIYTAFNSALSGGFAGTGGSSDDTAPSAWLNFIMFDENMVPNSTVLPMAAQHLTSAANMAQQKLSIGPINIPTSGFVYIYLNDNSNVNNWVYFDDLKVTHLHSPYVAGGDFYPFGLPIDDRSIRVQDYRYDFQGQSSEKNKVTGWNEFKLRNYDARIGRWVTTDPYSQYASPYLAMGNTPTMNIDPDGGFAMPLMATRALVGAAVGTIAGLLTDKKHWAYYTLAYAGIGAFTGTRFFREKILGEDELPTNFGDEFQEPEPEHSDLKDRVEKVTDLVSGLFPEKGEMPERRENPFFGGASSNGSNQVSGNDTNARSGNSVPGQAFSNFQERWAFTGSSFASPPTPKTVISMLRRNAPVTTSVDGGGARNQNVIVIGIKRQAGKKRYKVHLMDASSGKKYWRPLEGVADQYQSNVETRQ